MTKMTTDSQLEKAARIQSRLSQSKSNNIRSKKFGFSRQTISPKRKKGLYLNTSIWDTKDDDKNNPDDDGIKSTIVKFYNKKLNFMKDLNKVKKGIFLPNIERNLLRSNHMTTTDTSTTPWSKKINAMKELCGSSDLLVSLKYFLNLTNQSLILFDYVERFDKFLV